MISRLSFLFFSFLGLATHLSLASDASKKNAVAGYAAVQDIDAPDANKQTALIRAVIDENEKEVQELLAQKANPDIQDKYNKTALLWALGTEKLEIAKALLKAGARVDLEDIETVTPLMEAVRLNNAELTNSIIQALRKHATTLQVSDDEKILDTKAFRKLLNLQDKFGRTALMRVQAPEIAKILIDAGANIFIKDKKGKSIEAILQEKLSQTSAKKEKEERSKLAEKYPTLVASRLTEEQQEELEERKRTKISIEEEILLLVREKKEEKERALCRLAQKPDVFGVVKLILEGVSPDAICLNAPKIRDYDADLEHKAFAWAPTGESLVLAIDAPHVLDAVLGALNDVIRQRFMSIDPEFMDLHQADDDFSRILEAYKSIIRVLINNHAQLNYTVAGGETPLDKVFEMIQAFARDASRYKRPSIIEYSDILGNQIYKKYQSLIKELIAIKNMLEEAGGKARLFARKQAQLQAQLKTFLKK